MSSSHFFSRFYRGFTCQQTERGWIILNWPNRAPSGPLNQGPFGTYEIACHQIDRLLRESGT